MQDQREKAKETESARHFFTKSPAPRLPQGPTLQLQGRKNQGVFWAPQNDAVFF